MAQKARSSTALVVQRETASDVRLVDAAIAGLLRIWRGGLLATVVAAGDHLIEHFYGGDLELAAARRVNKPFALKMLFERAAELPVSPHALKEAVRIAVQYHTLPRVLADRLSKQQHAVLLRIGDPGQKRLLAEEALRDGLSTRELERKSIRIQRPHAGGRPRRSPLIGRVDAALRALTDESSRDLMATAALRKIDVEERRRLASAARRLRDVAEKLGDALARVDGKAREPA